MVDITDYMDIKTAARRLGVSRQDVEYHIARNHIETETISGKTVIHHRALQTFVWSDYYRGKKKSEGSDNE